MTNNQTTATNAILFQNMMQMTLPKIATTNGKYTFGIVNSQNNGKRVTISKALAQVLGLDNTAMFMPSKADRKLVVGRTLPFPSAIKGNLSGTDKKTCYLTALVTLLTQIYELDFSKHVSRTFGDIEIDEVDGMTVAIISFPDAEPTVDGKAKETVVNDTSEKSA